MASEVGHGSPPAVHLQTGERGACETCEFKVNDPPARDAHIPRAGGSFIRLEILFDQGTGASKLSQGGLQAVQEAAERGADIAALFGIAGLVHLEGVCCCPADRCRLDPGGVNVKPSVTRSRIGV